MVLRAGMTFRFAVVLTLVFIVFSGLAVPGHAETRHKVDPEPWCSQGAALDVKRARFTLTKTAFKVSVKMARLSKKHTQVIARFTLTRPTGVYDVMLFTKYRNGTRRTFGYWSDSESEARERFRRGLNSRWDWRKRRITFTLTEHLRGRRVAAFAYTVPKGAMHGPPCGDYLYVRGLKRA